MNIRTKWALLAPPAVLVVAIIGYFSGIAVSDLRTSIEEKARDEGMQKYMNERLEGIDIGQPLPQIPVWSADGLTGYLLDQTLPRGGLITYVSGNCESCKQAVSALSAAHDALNLDTGLAVVLVAGDPKELIEYMAERHFAFPVYRDVEHRLSSEYRLSTFPTVMVLDSIGVVREIKTGMDKQDEYLEVCKQLLFPS